MKKISILSIVFAALSAFSAVTVSASDFEVISKQSSPVLLAQDVAFRSLQRMRSSDGREIYFYSSGRKCEGFDEDGRLLFTTTYSLNTGANEFRLLDEYGNTVYKGSYVRKRDGNLSSIYLAGTTYYAR